MTVGLFENLVNTELPAVNALLAPPNPPRSGSFPYSEIQYEHQGVEIYPTHYPMARSYQTSIGVQRELGWGMVVTADWARRSVKTSAWAKSIRTYSRDIRALPLRFRDSAVPNQPRFQPGPKLLYGRHHLLERPGPGSL